MKTLHPFLIITFALLGLLLACEEDFLDDIPYTPPPTTQSTTTGGIIIPKQNSIPPAKEYEKVLLTNRELIQALIREGYTFVGDSLVKNEKFATTTVLNLSHAGLKNINNIEIFTLLEKVNLSHNNFESISFDFGQLPPKVQEIDLQENQLYEFENLAYTNYNTGEFSLKRRFDKIIFPASARFNVEHTLAYYNTCNGCDMQIPNPHKNNALEPLTNLRYVPCLAYFNMIKNLNDKDTTSADIIVEEKQSIDLYKIHLLSQIHNIYYDDTMMKCEDIEHLAFIVNSPNATVDNFLYKETANQFINKEKQREQYSLPYIKVFKNIKYFSTVETIGRDKRSSAIQIQHLNLSQAVGLQKLVLFNQPIEKLNLTHTQLFANGVAELSIIECTHLEELLLPTQSISEIKWLILWGNPLSKTMDLNLSNVSTIKQGGIALSGNINITFPTKIDETNVFFCATPAGAFASAPTIPFYIEEKLAEKHSGKTNRLIDTHRIVVVYRRPANWVFKYIAC